ncbi:hypothetical protein NKY68_12270 [Sinorhizobium meliloti]|uniref:hypothetical protein n=1 Tax=Rhizobium meliloti TaxID=382 RepID=UPI003D652A8E
MNLASRIALACSLPLICATPAMADFNAAHLKANGNIPVCRVFADFETFISLIYAEREDKASQLDCVVVPDQSPLILLQTVGRHRRVLWNDYEGWTRADAALNEAEMAVRLECEALDLDCSSRVAKRIIHPD